MLLAVSTTGQERLLINASTQLETGSGRGARALRLSKVIQGMLMGVLMTSAGPYKRQAMRFSCKPLWAEIRGNPQQAKKATSVRLHVFPVVPGYKKTPHRKICCSAIPSLSPTTSTLLVTLGKAQAMLRSFRNLWIACGKESAQSSNIWRDVEVLVDCF